jgi:hypothetical protein
MASMHRQLDKAPTIRSGPDIECVLPSLIQERGSNEIVQFATSCSLDSDRTILGNTDRWAAELLWIWTSEGAYDGEQLIAERLKHRTLLVVNEVSRISQLSGFCPDQNMNNGRLLHDGLQL